MLTLIHFRLRPYNLGNKYITTFVRILKCCGLVFGMFSAQMHQKATFLKSLTKKLVWIRRKS
jgi:hypothetical protein